MAEVRLDIPALLSRLRKIGRPHVLVVGDLILDRWLIGKVERLSPEAPVPVVKLSAEEPKVTLGGAANVARNLVTLGAQVTVCGLVGRDGARKSLEKHLDQWGICKDALIAEKGRPTTVKTRIIGGSQQIVRVDRESSESASPASLRKMKAQLDRLWPSLGAVVVSDYGKGAITMTLLDHLRERIGKTPLPVVVDPKDVHFSSYRSFTVITPNVNEASLGAGFKIKDDATLREAGWKLQGDLDLDAMLITRGAEGMSLFERGHSKESSIGTRAREVFDVTGAGDTVVAAMALALAEGVPLLEAAELANFAAGVVVGKMGTASVTRPELKKALEAFAGESGRKGRRKR